MLSVRTKGLILNVAVNSTQGTGDSAINLAAATQMFIEDWLRRHVDKKKRAEKRGA